MLCFFHARRVGWSAGPWNNRRHRRFNPDGIVRVDLGGDTRTAGDLIRDSFRRDCSRRLDVALLLVAALARCCASQPNVGHSPPDRSRNFRLGELASTFQETAGDSLRKELSSARIPLRAFASSSLCVSRDRRQPRVSGFATKTQSLQGTKTAKKTAIRE